MTMSLHRRAAPVMAVFALLATGGARAACIVDDLTPASPSGSGNYAFTTAGKTTLTYALTFDVSSAPCELHVFLDAIRVLQSGAETLGFTVETDGGATVQPLPSQPPATASALSFSVPVDTDDRALSLNLVFDAGQMAPAGTYSVMHDLTIWEHAGSSFQHRATAAASATMTVASTATVAIGGVINGSQTMAFETMTTGEAGSADLTIVSNEPFDLGFESDNDGVMAHTVQGVGDARHEVSYTLTSDGAVVDLTGGATAQSFGAATGSAGRVVPLGVTLGAVEARRAGSYADAITIEVTAQ